MSPAGFEQAGSQAQHQTHWAPIFIESLWPGLVTNRSILQSSGSMYEQKYLGGRPGSLCGGLNCEVSIRNTMIRRYGTTPFSTVLYPTVPDSAFSFTDLNGFVRVLIDTASSGSLVLSAVASSVGGSAVYTGVFPSGGTNAYAGLTFQITGFSNPANNGVFVASASTTTTLTLNNAAAISESHAAAAVTAGAVYYDQQNGSATLLWVKLPGALQTTFVAVAGIVYAGDGVSTHVYSPNTSTGTVFNWGITAPINQPNVVITESAASAVAWQANSIYSTMGLVVDTNGNIWQLNSVNTSGTNTTRYGNSGNGQPAWAQTPGSTTVDNTVTFTNYGPIGLWQPHQAYSNASIGGTVASPCAIYDPASNCVFLVFNAGFAGGTSGVSQPHFTNNPGSFISDGTIKWGCMGLPSVWQKSHAYTTWGNPNPANDVGRCAVEPLALTNPLPTQTIWLQVATTGGMSGSGTATPFPATPSLGDQQYDGDLIWNYLSSSTWAATTAMSGWSVGATQFNVVIDANNNYQVCTTTGTTDTVVPGTSYTLTGVTQADPISGEATYAYNSTTPVPVGVGSLNLVVTGFSNSGNNGVFQIVSSTATSVVVKNSAAVTEVHAGTGVYNPWSTVYGSTTNDGTAIFTCVGQKTAWAASTIWYLPLNGFAPPSSSQPYGGAAVVANSDVQFVINSGKSGSSAPSWNPVGQTTSDNTITWYADAVATTNSLAWQFGLTYAFSYYSRTLTDIYSPSPLGGGLIPPGLATALGPPTGSETGAISSASPVFAIVGSNAGAVNTISGIGSTDPAVDTIILWRSGDSASGSDNMFFLTEIPNPKPINGVAQPWSFQDYLPSVASGVYPGLNVLLPAPIDGVNDPAPSSSKPTAYNFQRIWVMDGNEILFSGGPDTQVGNPNFAFNISDSFPFLNPVIRGIKTANGLIVFTTGSIEIIAGGPATASFYSVTLADGIGLGNFNSADIYAGEIFFADTTGSLRVLSPSLSLSSSGWAISDQLQQFNPKTMYVVFNDGGTTDAAIYIGTGLTPYNGMTGYFRMNPRQVPGGINGPEPVWSPFAAITGGCGMMASVQVLPGVKKLLIGGTAANESILERNVTVFSDNGTAYDANFQIGALMLAHRGELAALKFIEMDCASATTASTITLSYLLNNISGVYTPFASGVGIFDPPQIFGAILPGPSGYNPLRWYFASNASLALCDHMNVGVDFGTSANADEVFNMTIFGKVIKFY